MVVAYADYVLKVSHGYISYLFLKMIFNNHD